MFCFTLGNNNNNKIKKQYSEDFEKEFLDVLSRRHGTKRVRASLVYNEFIAHKTHTHMNSTHWETLTSFVLYLGKVSEATWLCGELFPFLFCFFPSGACIIRASVHQCIRSLSLKTKTKSRLHA